MPRFITGKQVYDRIRWDPVLDPIWFTIGFVEREADGGVAELPYEDFVPDGDVPWHRLRYFRVGEFVVWDRAGRVDRLSELHAAAASAAAQEEFLLPVALPGAAPP